MTEENNHRPAPFKIYKANGAMKMSILAPKFDAKGYVSKEGALLIEAAPGNGDKNNPQWDWNQKITFAISSIDVASLLSSKQKRIFHQHNDDPKTLELLPGEGEYAGTYRMVLAIGKGTARQQVMVPMSDGEYQLFMRMVMSGTTLILNWTENAVANLVRG